MYTTNHIFASTAHCIGEQVMADDDKDGPPPAHSARIRPARSASQSHLSSSSAVPRRSGIDPRFQEMLGKVNMRQFEQNYSFLREQSEEEESARRFRIRCLRCVLRRHELEDAGEDVEQYDLSDDERDTFGPEHAQELREMKCTPPVHLYAELERLKGESTLHKARTRNQTALTRQQSVRKELMKKELNAVRAGQKSRMYFPKKQAVKRAVLADTFDKLEESGGRAAVDRYVQRKQARR